MFFYDIVFESGFIIIHRKRWYIVIKIEKILLPTDFSEHSKIAVSYALDLARKYSAEVHIIHVFDESALDPVIIAFGSNIQEYLAKFQGGFEDAVNKFLAEWNIEGLKIIKIFKHGNPFYEMVTYARKNCMDLIVMGTHGRTGLAHMVLGSTTEKVIRKAHCPVLAVRRTDCMNIPSGK